MRPSEPHAAPALSIPRRSAYSAFTALAFFGLLELALRAGGVAAESPFEWVGADFGSVFPHQRDDELFWSLVPNAEIPHAHEHLNAHGFRGDDFDDEKPRDTRRVLLLGDSNTFGIGVSWDATFAHRLERWLDRTEGTHWEVLNMGVPGYSVVQMRRLLESDGARWGPDVVVVYAGAWNDYTPAVGLDDELVEAELERTSWTDLRTMGLAHRLIGSRPAHVSRRADYVTAWGERRERPDGPRVAADRFRANLVRICERATDLGAQPILIVPPAPRETRARFPEGEEYAKVVRSLATDFPVVDARAILGDLDESALHLFTDFIHPGVDGHETIAAALAAELAALGVPGAPPAPDGDSFRAVLLERFAAQAQLLAGDPLAPAPLSQVATPDPHCWLQPPSRLIVRDVLVPPQGSFVATLSYLPQPDVEARDARPVVLSVLVSTGDGEPVPLLREQLEPDAEPRTVPRLRRVDLAAYEGRVTLVLEAQGPPVSTLFEEPALWPFR